MLDQRVTGNFPTSKPKRSRYRPTTPERRNRGAVGGATGADPELQGVPRRDASRPTPKAPVTPLRILIEPTGSGRKWIARLGDRVLCVSASPFVKSARFLMTEGLPAATVIEMWRPNTDEAALHGRLGMIAATVIDGETTSHGAKNGPSANGTENGTHQRALGLR
jgi:hypothetical protein